MKGLLKSIGVDRTEGVVQNEDGTETVEKIFGAAAVKDFALSDDEYKLLCEQNGYAPEPAAGEKAEATTGDKPVLMRSRIHTFRGSDETKDGMGDIIRVEGWRLERFMKNPVFLAQHESWDMPVGRALRVWKETADAGAPGGKSLMFRIYFPAGVSEKVDAMHELYKSGILSAVSVGFIGLKANYPKDEAERQALGLGKYGVEFLEQELLELSGVTIPANSNAVKVKSLHEKELCAKIGVPAEVDAGAVTEPGIIERMDALEKAFVAMTENIGKLLLLSESIQKSVHTVGHDGGTEGNAQHSEPEAAPAADVFELAKAFATSIHPQKKE